MLRMHHRVFCEEIWQGCRGFNIDAVLEAINIQWNRKVLTPRRRYRLRNISFYLDCFPGTPPRSSAASTTLAPRIRPSSSIPRSVCLPTRWRQWARYRSQAITSLVTVSQPGSSTARSWVEWSVERPCNGTSRKLLCFKALEADRGLPMKRFSKQRRASCNYKYGNDQRLTEFANCVKLKFMCS